MDNTAPKLEWQKVKQVSPRARTGGASGATGPAGADGGGEAAYDVEADPDYSWEAIRVIRNRTLLGVPILMEEELIGAMVVGRRVPEPFSNEQIELVKTFADQAAIAITNTRLIDAVERQKTELSRFVSPRVAELVSSGEGKKMLAGHRAYISCLFCDLRGFPYQREQVPDNEIHERPEQTALPRPRQERRT